MALPTRVQRSQYDPFESAQRDFDSMLGRWFGGRQENGGSFLAPYGVDVREDGDHLYVEAELPGYSKNDVDITLENNTLTISAERSESREQSPQGQQHQQQKSGKQGDPQIESRPKGDYLLRERRYSRFQRSFTLPPTIDEQTVNAKLDNGVLTITLNKREETKPRKVQVS
jgi:HSP20 family protein